jgi:CheY-like chemotaxis protein
MKKKVLVVEDDNDLRRGLRLRLAALGYDVVEASDGYFAVEVARKELPDVVLLDIGLPCGDGISVLERYETLPQLDMMPVVVLTGRDPFTVEPLVRAHNVSAFLRKPADNTELAAAIARALGDGQLEPTSTGSSTDRG